MGRVIMNAAVSLDGFIAYDDTVGPLFDWYGNGDVPFSFDDEHDPVVRVTRPTADFLRDEISNIGAIVAGAGCSTSRTAGEVSHRPATTCSW